MSACICDFPTCCDGRRVLYCRGCGGDFCVCAACYGNGEVECDGCEDCRLSDPGNIGWDDSEESP